jgi:dihydroorotate dehydrogenase (fumarate)
MARCCRRRGSRCCAAGWAPPLAATTGVEDPADVAKYLLAGADVVMTASALLRHGPEHATVLLDGLSEWMARKGFDAVDELRGILSVPPGTDAAAYERAGYVTGLRAANVRTYRAW